MIGRKLLSGFLLICIPAALATLLFVLGYFKLAPTFEREDRLRLTGEYREIAADLKENPKRGARVLPARRGESRSMKPGRWGYVEEEAHTVVWYAEGKRSQSVTVPRVTTLSSAGFLQFTLIISLLILWGLTLAGCGMFRWSVKERDDFVAATAHDLTTPLVALRRFIGHDDGEARLLAERMVRLIQNLTDFLRLGGKRPSPELTKVPFRAAFDEAYSLFAEDYRWQHEGADIEVKGDDSLSLWADETMTVQILWNLLANDLKYAAPFGPVTVRVAREGSFVRISFMDLGKGLLPRERKRIFNRYYRAKSVMKSGKGGFGIGLCTAREFARAMGGDLTVSSNVPKGTVFHLILRRAP